jgi:CDP-diacylglycerol--serine O-phosphatidyltransferase
MRPSRALWPNLLTVTNLFLGFIAILLVIDGRMVTAAWMIIAAGIVDAFDGKLARYIRTQSQFGMELDSLADVVSFGVATSILLYVNYFNQLGSLGILLAFFPMLFCAVRLARFNVSSTLPTDEHPVFIGLPTPIQACTLVSFIIFNYRLGPDLKYGVFLIPLVIITSLLMVSHVPFDTFPRFSFHSNRTNLVKLILLLTGLVAVLIKPALMFFPVITAFVLLEAVKGIITLIFRTPEVEELVDGDEVEDEGWVG